MAVAEAAKMMLGEIIRGDSGRRFDGVVLDSRRVRGRELFFALPGERADGHRFVAAALRAGAAGAVVEERFCDAPGSLEDLPREALLVRVEDGVEALHALTRGLRQRMPEKLVGITGSAGKTTTKELLAAMLGQRYRVARSPGNYNNLLGFPMALAGIPADTEWMVAEMGMSQPGELGELSRLARPDVAVYTNVRPAHLEFFGSLRAVADAKAELLAGLAPGGLMVINGDDPEVRRIAEAHHGPSVVYGRSADAEVRAEAVRPAAGDLGGCTFTLALAARGGEGEERVEIELPLHGLYNVENCLAAAACAWKLGVSPQEIAAAVREVRPVAGRGALHRLAGGVSLIDDAYNSNPDAVRRALDSAARIAGSRRWTVLGDMLELGPVAPRYHREVGSAAAELGFSPVLAVGALAESIAEGARAAGGEARAFGQAPAAAEAAVAELADGDVVLIKGSRGVGLDVVVEALLAARAVGGAA